MIGERSIYEPYPIEAANRLYSLLFCDIPSIYGEWTQGVGEPVFAEAFNERAVRAVADNKNAESRLRALAYRRLMVAGRIVPQRLLLGVIVETPLKRGLDTMAAYVDGRIRYIHGSGKEIVVERDISAMRAPRRALLAAAQDIVDELTPLEDFRSPPPKIPNVRVTSLVSDGLYVGEANLKELTQDPLGGPILRATGDLLDAVIDYAKTNTP